MDLNPPAGSNISVVSEGGDPTIVIPVAGGVSHYFTGLFLLFWLGMWTVAFRDVSSKILSGNFNAFLVLWLGAWTAGGMLAAYAMYRSLRPSVPETLQLARNSVLYDSGIAPPQFATYSTYGRYRSPVDAWKAAFPKRVRAKLDRRQLQSLRLRETDAGNRLTVDVNADRIELAKGASEVEREWLARLLAWRYSLATVSGGASDAAPS